MDHGLAEPRLEAEVLLAHVLQKDRVYLYANYEEPVNGREREDYRNLIKRRARGEPCAYLVGHREFMSLDLVVTPDVLIPRPDTEVLVETVINLSREKPEVRICDVGTGSGAIAVSLAVYVKNAAVWAVDISNAALQVARQNADVHGVNIDFRAGDLLAPIPENEKMDIIAANLPYISEEQRQELDTGVKDFEPALALFSSGDGLDHYRRLLPQAEERLTSGGYLLIEIDPRQTGAAVEMLQGFEDIKIIKDYSGRNRVVQARMK
jgi:release factor glutamine methyltransferase